MAVVAGGHAGNIAERALPKIRTGIQGLDEITGGGIPLGRPTLVCGTAGCGKTLLAMEFLVRGATQFNEPGVFMAFEETAAEGSRGEQNRSQKRPGSESQAGDKTSQNRHVKPGEYHSEGLWVLGGPWAPWFEDSRKVANGQAVVKKFMQIVLFFTKSGLTTILSLK